MNFAVIVTAVATLTAYVVSGTVISVLPDAIVAVDGGTTTFGFDVVNVITAPGGGTGPSSFWDGEVYAATDNGADQLDRTALD